MPTTSMPFRRRGALSAAAVAVAAVTAAGGCGGEIQEYSPNRAADGAVGQIRLRNVFLLGAPAGQAATTAPLFFTLVNESGRPDRLTSVSAPGLARSTRIVGGSLPVPPAQPLYGGPAPQVMLTGLTKNVTANVPVDVTFTFQHAGKGTLTVPVMAPVGIWRTYRPSPTGPVSPNTTGPASPGAG